jgi:hypothetical protein
MTTSNTSNTTTKRLSQAAWDALSEALAVFYWYRGDFEAFLRAELTDVPELLARLNFTLTKREVSADVVAYLRHGEDRHQSLAIDLLVHLGEFDPRFPRLARLDDGEAKVAKAQAALEDVRTVVASYGELAAAREQVRAEAQRLRRDEKQRRDQDSRRR